MNTVKFVNEDDEFKELVIEFLNCKGMLGVNGFREDFISQFKFDSSGHPRWDFTYSDERDYNVRDWESLVSLNLAWDCFFDGCCKL